MTRRLKVARIPYQKTSQVDEDEPEDLDVGVSFDGYRLCLNFEDGDECLIIFDELLSAINAVAEYGCESEEAMEGLEALLTRAKAYRKNVKELKQKQQKRWKRIKQQARKNGARLVIEKD